MVLGGEHRTTLGIVRHLSKLGIPIFVGGNSRLARSLHSRFRTRSFVYPPINESLGAAHAVVIEKVRQWRPDVLLPSMDPSWNLVRSFADEYAELTSVVAHPTEETFEQVTNKGTMTRRAQALGVDTPATFFPQPEDPDSAMRHDLRYPVLVKPLEGVEGKGIVLARDAAQLKPAVHALDGPFLIQEFIAGQDLDLTILCDQGEPVAGSAYANLRNAPLPYGPPVACRTINDEQLMDAGIRLLRGLGYHGVAHLDFRRDPGDGKPKLLDFNARLAGTNEMSLVSGINFPLLMYRMALGERVEPAFTYPPGLEFRWSLGELRHFIQTSNKSDVIRAYTHWRGVTTDLSPTDPMPHLAHLLSVLTGASKP